MVSAVPMPLPLIQHYSLRVLDSTSAKPLTLTQSEFQTIHLLGCGLWKVFDGLQRALVGSRNSFC